MFHIYPEPLFYFCFTMKRRNMYPENASLLVKWFCFKIILVEYLIKNIIMFKIFIPAIVP